MIVVLDTALARAIPEAGRSVRPRRAVVGLSVGAGTQGLLDAWPLNARLGMLEGSVGVLAGPGEPPTMPCASQRRG